MRGKTVFLKYVHRLKSVKWNQKRFRLVLKILGWSIAGFFLLLFIFILSVYFGAFGRLPDQDKLREIRNYTASEVYSSDNYLLGRYYLENRTNSRLDEIPDCFIEGLLATEDARFYKHSGVDLRSTLRVLVKSLLLRRNAGGGSTLTQQLAKNLYPREENGFLSLPVAKLKEIFIANRLEKVYSKEEILELYLNTVPFGDNTYGVETASLVFFNKKPIDLKVEEAAVLIGMLKANSQYNPVVHYEASLQRRNVILDQMVKYDYLDASEADSLKQLPIELDYRKFQHDVGVAPYLRAYLLEELKNWAASHPKEDGTAYNIYTDGLKIYTTIDYSLQVLAEQAMKKHMSKLQSEFFTHWQGQEPWRNDPMMAIREIRASQRYKSYQKKGLTEPEILEKLRQPQDSYIFTWDGNVEKSLSPIDSVIHHFGMLQTGLISMESHSGFVKVWVGGIDYKFFKYDHVTAYRQTGSTFKPFVYAAGLETGMDPCDLFRNDSVVYEDYDNWTPRNADRSYGGLYSMKGALAHSVNTVSVKILMEAGIDNTVKLSRQAGFSGDLPEMPSLALGTGTASLYELVQAYSIFLNQGRKVKPVIIRRIEDANGNVLFAQGPEIDERQVITEENAERILAMLSYAVQNGTASSIRTQYQLNNDIAGKTGTTQNQTDGWFVGLTPDLITGVWVGGDNPVVRFRSIRYGQGAHTALPIFAHYMDAVYHHPVYRASKTSSFSFTGKTRAEMDCPDFKEKRIESLRDLVIEAEKSLDIIIDRIFKPRPEQRKKRKHRRHE